MSQKQTDTKSNSHITPIILAFLPLILLITAVIKYHIDIPHNDSWNFVYLLEKMYGGTLTLGDIYYQHCEHRMLFPKLISLPLARLTGWNTGYEVAISIMLAAGLFAILARQSLSIKISPWMLPVLSMIVFSLSQSENWLWGWQIQIFLGVLGVTWGLILLLGQKFSWGRYTAALTLGIVAMYSYATGLLFFPVGIILLAYLPIRSGENRKLTFALLLIVAASSIILYLHGYRQPEVHPTLSAVSQQPVEYASYVLKYLGNTAVPISSTGALLAGAIVLVVFIWSGSRTIRVIGFAEVAPFISLGLFSLFSALFTAFGRTSFGSGQALCSRYITFSNLIWIPTLIFLLILYSSGVKSRQLSRTLPVILICLFVFMLGIKALGGIRGFWLTNANFSAERSALLNSSPEYIPNNNAHLIKILKDYRLSVFRE